LGVLLNIIYLPFVISQGQSDRFQGLLGINLQKFDSLDCLPRLLLDLGNLQDTFGKELHIEGMPLDVSLNKAYLLRRHLDLLLLGGKLGKQRRG
jgi:hypothetical protein